MRGEKILLLVLAIYFLSAILTSYALEKAMRGLNQKDKAYSFFEEASRIMDVEKILKFIPYIPVFNSLFAVALLIKYSVGYIKKR